MRSQDKGVWGPGAWLVAAILCVACGFVTSSGGAFALVPLLAWTRGMGATNFEMAVAGWCAVLLLAGLLAWCVVTGRLGGPDDENGTDVVDMGDDESREGTPLPQENAQALASSSKPVAVSLGTTSHGA